MRRINLILLVAAVMLVSAAAARAALHESANYVPPGAPAGYLKIDPATCRFIHPEIDVAPNAHERYARAEDSRDDVKLSCLTRKVDREKVSPAPTLQYKSVTAFGTGQVVTAQCPAGYYVSGGGSESETTGSWPVGNDAWSVRRDHLSPRRLDVTAICIQVA